MRQQTRPSIFGQNQIYIVHWCGTYILYLLRMMDPGSSSSQESTALKVPVIDAEGYTICPDCDSRINCGMVRLANLEKRHRGKKVCKAAQEKWDRKAKKKQNGTILTFLKPKASMVPSTVGSQALILGCSALSQQLAIGSLTTSTTILQDKAISPGPLSISETFINTLRNLVNNLPENVPEAIQSDRLAVFGRSLMEFDDSTLDAEELWETRLNHVLKSALGWGGEVNMDEIIRRGKWGLNGLVKFAMYFVEKRGVSHALFEGKLANLVTALR